jgi:hypothetical protein
MINRQPVVRGVVALRSTTDSALMSELIVDYVKLVNR